MSRPNLVTERVPDKITSVQFSCDDAFEQEGPDHVPGMAILAKSGDVGFCSRFEEKFKILAATGFCTDAAKMANEALREAKNDTLMGKPSYEVEAEFLLGYFDTNLKLYRGSYWEGIFSPVKAGLEVIGPSHELGGFLLRTLGEQQVDYNTANHVAAYVVTSCIRFGRDCEEPIQIGHVSQGGCEILSQSTTEHLQNASNLASEAIRDQIQKALFHADMRLCWGDPEKPTDESKPWAPISPKR